MKRIAALVLSLIFVLALCAGAAAEEKIVAIRSRDVDIPATLVTPDGVSSYPLVVLVHGHGGTRDENFGYPAIAQALAAKGIASLRMDMPGCGDSTESFQKNCLSNMKTDVRRTIAWARENLSVTKMGLFGYSMGGRITLELLAEGDQFDAVGLLAPAADNACFTNFLGGEEKYAEQYKEACEKGFIVFTTQFGQVQELSQAWFDDLLIWSDTDALLAAAATRCSAPALVIWAQDDSIVDPATSAAVADALHAQTIDATGNDHGYSFYADDQDAIRNAVVDGVASFFETNLAVALAPAA